MMNESAISCLRFSGLELKDRFETSLACEIWLDDACNARWATNGTMKLAAVIAQAIKNNDGRPIDAGRLDSLCALTRDEALLALKQMKMFGLIADFQQTGARIGVACRLSHSGEIRFLDMKHKFDVLGALAEKRSPGAPAASVPPAAAIVVAADDAAAKIVPFRPRGTGKPSQNVAHGDTVI